MGYEVQIVASTETYKENATLGYVRPSSYFSDDGIKITRLPYVRYLPQKIARKLRLYVGLKRVLEDFDPDILFIHDSQFLSAPTVVRFAKRRNRAVYVDTHTDFVNSARGFISRHILHGIFYRWSTQKLAEVARCFWATLPLRAEFLKTVYDIPSDKIRLLPFGADDARISGKNIDLVRREVRLRLKIGESDLVFVSGGKIDRRKDIHTLMRAFCYLVEEGKLSNAHLVIFGSPTPDMIEPLREFEGKKGIHWMGWTPANEIYQYLWAADLGFFPGTHSVLWEEAVGLGIPCVFKRWCGIDHLDVGGNCILLDEGTTDQIAKILLRAANEPAWLEDVRDRARALGPMHFSYSAIARMSIGLSPADD